MKYTKEDVKFHREGYYGKSYPAVNVKVYHWPKISDLERELSCSEEEAEKAVEIAFQSAQEAFWQLGEAEEIVNECFGKGVKFYSEGRSGGWLIVQGLKDFEYWDAIDLAKWRKFEKMIKAEVKWLTSTERMVEEIRANEWATPISETGDACLME